MSHSDVDERVANLADRFDALEEENQRLEQRVENVEAENRELRDTVDQVQRENRELRKRAERAEAAAHAQSAHVRYLLAKVEKNGEKPGRFVWNQFFANLCDLDIDDYEGDPVSHLPSVKRLGGMIRRHESLIEENGGSVSSDPMSDNWQAAVETAQNLKNNAKHARQDGYVQLFAENLEAATGHGNRHCLKLIEDLAEAHEGADWQSYRRNVKQGGSDRKKALLIDLDVWGEN